MVSQHAQVGLTLCLFTLCSMLAPSRVQGQFTTVLNIPPDPDIGDYQSIGSDTQLNLSNGGSIGARVSVTCRRSAVRRFLKGQTGTYRFWPRASYLCCLDHGIKGRLWLAISAEQHGIVLSTFDRPVVAPGLTVMHRPKRDSSEQVPIPLEE